MVKKMSGSSKYEFISNNRSRRTTFKNRKKSLIKKIEQLSILCGIDVGAIIFANDEDAEHGKQQLTVWPNHTKIQDLVSLYKAKAKAGDSCGGDSDSNSCDSSSSSEDSKIPRLGTSWYDDLNELVHIVERRIAAVDNKIDFLRRREGMPESVSELSHRCRHAVHCCCRGCSVVDPGCSHHRGVNITLHGTCNACVPNQMPN